MENISAVVLKPGREVHARNRHPWVFLGAVAKFPTFENGDLLPVVSADGNHIGHGYFHAGQSIVGRMINFSTEDPLATIARNLAAAVALRKRIIPKETTAFRVINSEGDGLPGLIVDAYGRTLVLQINTLGMERLKPFIIEKLAALLSPAGIFEKSNSATRKKEGLPAALGLVMGQGEDTVEAFENGLTFSVSLTEGQKTGFFLDQREMRGLVKIYARERTVLNCFGYSGGFSVYAHAGQATRVDTIDTDEDALALAKTNIARNGFSVDDANIYSQDVFSFLSQRTLPADYDFIILDPPAFAKRASDIKNASRGYRELNRLAIKHLKPGSLLLTASCSSHIDAALFQTIVFQAMKDAGRDGKIISTHVLAADHPISIYFPEGNYLKSLLLVVE